MSVGESGEHFFGTALSVTSERLVGVGRRAASLGEMTGRSQRPLLSVDAAFGGVDFCCADGADGDGDNRSTFPPR